MQMLANLAFGAVLAGLSLGPAGWADMSALEAQLSHAVMTIAGAKDAGSPLDHAVTRARAALPELPNGSH
jgi:hypothetical protein